MWESTAEEGSWQVRGLSFALRAPGSHGRLREGEGRLCFNEILKGTLEGPRLDSRDQGGGGEAGGGLDQSRDHEKGGRETSACERSMDRLSLAHLQLGTWPATQACALTGN